MAKRPSSPIVERRLVDAYRLIDIDRRYAQWQAEGIRLGVLKVALAEPVTAPVEAEDANVIEGM